MKSLLGHIRMLAFVSVKTEVFWIVAIIAIGLFFPTYSAHASVFSWTKDMLLGVVTTSLLAIPTFILVLIQSILGLFVMITGALMDQVLKLALEIRYVPGVTGDAVTVSWTIMRDIANMALILVLAALGIGSILGKGVEKIGSSVAKFIGVALLINFTPVLTGIIIDLSNILTYLFFSSVEGGYKLFLKDLGEGFGSLGAFFTLNASASINAMISAIVSIGFNIFTTAAFVLVSVLLIARIVALWMLVILSPIVFVAYILPQTKKLFDEWWKAFWQWSIIGIPLGFFLFLSMTIMKTGSESCKNTALNDGFANQINSLGGSVGGMVGGSGFLSDMCGSIVHIIALSMLFVGFFITFKLSATGSGMIMARAKQAGQWLQQQATSPKNLARAARIGMRTNIGVAKIAGRGIAGAKRKGLRGTLQTIKGAPKAATDRARAAGPRGVLKGAAGFGQKMVGEVTTPKEQKAIKDWLRGATGQATSAGLTEEYKDLSKATKDELEQEIRSGANSKERRQAALMQMAKNHPQEFGKYSSVDKDTSIKILKNAKRISKLDEVLEKNPHYATDSDYAEVIGKSVEELVLKLTGKKLTDLSKQALGNGEVADALLYHPNFAGGKKGKGGLPNQLVGAGKWDEVTALSEGLKRALPGRNRSERMDGLRDMIDNENEPSRKLLLNKAYDYLKKAKSDRNLTALGFFDDSPPSGGGPGSGGGPSSSGPTPSGGPGPTPAGGGPSSGGGTSGGTGSGGGPSSSGPTPSGGPGSGGRPSSSGPTPSGGTGGGGDSSSRDYYEILGVERGDTKDKIRRAYLKLAKQYHPDKDGGDTAKFQKINEAYQALSRGSGPTPSDRTSPRESGGGETGGSTRGGDPANRKAVSTATEDAERTRPEETRSQATPKPSETIKTLKVELEVANKELVKETSDSERAGYLTQQIEQTNQKIAKIQQETAEKADAMFDALRESDRSKALGGDVKGLTSAEDVIRMKQGYIDKTRGGGGQTTKPAGGGKPQKPKSARGGKPQSSKPPKNATHESGEARKRAYKASQEERVAAIEATRRAGEIRTLESKIANAEIERDKAGMNEAADNWTYEIDRLNEEITDIKNKS